MNKVKAWNMAKIINAQVIKHEPFTRAQLDMMAGLTREDSDLLVHMIGVAFRAHNRALRRHDDAMAFYDSAGHCNSIECGKAHNPIVSWYRSMWDACGESVNTRYYVIGELLAREVLENCRATHNHADYSPTGQWFRSAPSIKHIRGNVWQVQSRASIDC